MANETEIKKVKRIFFTIGLFYGMGDHSYLRKIAEEADISL